MAKDQQRQEEAIDDSQEHHAAAKKDTPQHVKDKAARVAKLKQADVMQSTESMDEDIKVARKALHLFLNSRMIEAEEIIATKADSRLYYAIGYALIASLKGIMTFEPKDLATAISYCKDAIVISNHLRKHSFALVSLTQWVRGTGVSPQQMHSMNKVQKHAELIYAEALLLRSVLGIVYSGDFLAFVAEALNMRNAYGMYRALSAYVEWADERAIGAKRDKTIDEDFRSGVYLGNGLISMILGLLPSKVLKLMEAFGYTGDAEVGLRILAKAGKWSRDPAKLAPGESIETEGVRRAICDMAILLYHLVISTFIPVTGVNVPFADKVLHYELDRYPEGVFFLYFSGRLYSTQALAERAIKQYETARDIQQEYLQLKHICWWDMSLCHMSLTQWQGAYDAFSVLRDESNWSKAVYAYGKAANIYMLGEDHHKEEAAKLFAEVPTLVQRIAGKSIPIEKYVTRKAKKFEQFGRLLLPAMEFAYIYHCLGSSPRYIVFDEFLPEISIAFGELAKFEDDPSDYQSGADEYWDDFCLASFLRGVTLRYVAFPESHTKARPAESPIPIAECAEQARLSFEKVLENATKISYDHYLIYFTHYELGRLYAATGQNQKAKDEFNLILSGKTLEDKHRKGKYSMQNQCFLRSNGALYTLEEKEKAEKAAGKK